MFSPRRMRHQRFPRWQIASRLDRELVGRHPSQQMFAEHHATARAVMLLPRAEPPSILARSFKVVLRDPKVYLLACAYFCIIASIYALSFWLPTIVKSEGVDDTMLLGWYTAIPYVGAAVGMYAIGRRSDTCGERRYHSSIPALLAAVLLSLCVLADGHLEAVLILLTLATTMLWMAYTVFWAIPAQYIKGDAAAGGIALINTIGLSGGFCGPAIIGWTKTATGNLHLGLLIVAAVACCGAVLLVANRLPSPARRSGLETQR